MSEAGRRCGFVALIGAPNAGKSTLLNRFVGAKVSIVSPKVQTTRTRVLGIRIEDRTQIVFIDTPGIFRPRRRLDRAMVAAAWGGAGDADHICLLVDATRFRGGEADRDTRRIVDRLKETGGRAVLAINKVDAVSKPALLEMAAVLDGEGVFSETFMVSAEKGDGTGDLLSRLTGMMAPGPWMFPEDQISDMPRRLLAAEITREKLYLQLHQELPLCGDGGNRQLGGAGRRFGAYRADHLCGAGQPEGHRARQAGRPHQATGRGGARRASRVARTAHPTCSCSSRYGTIGATIPPGTATGGSTTTRDVPSREPFGDGEVGAAGQPDPP